MARNAGILSAACCLAIATVFAGALCAGSVWAADIPPSPITFPGKLTATKSPSGRFEVHIRRIRDEDGEPAYHLSLRDRRHNFRQNILTFDRSAILKWRPDADGFSLTNYAASNFTDCLVAVPKSTNGTDGLVDLRSMIERIKKQPELSIPESVANSHYYVACGRWNGANQVLVSVSGNKDEDGSDFSYDLKYDVARDTLQR